MATKNLLKQIRFLIRETGTSSKKTYPEYFRISDERDLKKLSTIIRRNDIRVYDAEQSSSARSVSGSEYMLKERGKTNTDVWVYYPWLKELVRFSVPEEHMNVHESDERSICFWGIDPIMAETAKMAALREIKALYIYDEPFSTTQGLLLRHENAGLSAPAALTRELFEINPFLKITHEELERHDIERLFTTSSSLPALMFSGSKDTNTHALLRRASEESSVPFVSVLKSTEKGKISFRSFFPDKLRAIQLGETCLAFFSLDNLLSGYTITIPSLSAVAIFTELIDSILNYQKSS